MGKLINGGVSSEPRELEDISRYGNRIAVNFWKIAFSNIEPFFLGIFITKSGEKPTVTHQNSEIYDGNPIPWIAGMESQKLLK